MYLHTWRDHRRYGYTVNRVFFTGVCIIIRMLHAHLWIWILSSLVQLDISRVSAARACNILYVFLQDFTNLATLNSRWNKGYRVLQRCVLFCSGLLRFLAFCLVSSLLSCVVLSLFWCAVAFRWVGLVFKQWLRSHKGIQRFTTTAIPCQGLQSDNSALVVFPVPQHPSRNKTNKRYVNNTPSTIFKGASGTQFST